MAQNSLATQFQPQALPKQPTVPLHSHSTQVVSKPATLPVSQFEKCLAVGLSLVLVVMALMVVNAKNGVSAAQQHLQDVNSQITRYENKNTSDRQTINELMNRSRLEKVAKQNGMTLSDSKVRNVNK